MLERALIIELIHHAKGTLDSIKAFTQLSLGKFNDREFGGYYCRTVTKDIEELNLLLNTFLNYLKATTPIRKKNSVNNLIEQVLEKHQAQLEKKKTKISKKLEKDLPEAILPDEHLRFILDSLLHYAISAMPPDGSIEFITRSFGPEKAPGGGQANRAEHIEILVSLLSYKKLADTAEKKLGTASSGREVLEDIVFRLIDFIVKMNKGMVEIGANESQTKKFIFLKFPVERRKVVSYQPTNE